MYYILICKNIELGQIFEGNLLFCEFYECGLFVIYFCYTLPQILQLKTTHLFFHHSCSLQVQHGAAGSLFNILLGWIKAIARITISSKVQSPFPSLQIISRIQFLATVELKSHFLAGCHVEPLPALRSIPHMLLSTVWQCAPLRPEGKSLHLF